MLAVQTRPVSGDNDGEVRDPPPPKSYSVGITIVSGCDSRLRRNVIEKIAARSSAGRVVVVTTSGMVSTDDPDGRAVTPPDALPANAEQLPLQGEMPPPEERLNGYAAPLEGTGDGVDTPRTPQNLEGWISCSSPEEMAEVVVKLAAGRDCDYIVAEGSADSSMEPQELARLLHSRGGASLRVDSLVSVLDGDTLLHDLSANASLSAPEQDGVDMGEPLDDVACASAMQDSTDTRPMVVVSLVENANVILVSSSGNPAQGEGGLSEVQNLLTVLNGSASVLRATDDVVPVDQLVNTNAYDHESVMQGPTWKKVLIASRNAAKGVAKPVLPKSLKDSTFVYRARRPFHPTRLYEHIKAVATFQGVIRSTGRIWLATRMLAPLVWNQAGVAATLSLGKLFWAAVPEAEWPKEEGERERIMEEWDTQYGDRETEIVFVGMGIDKERLQGLLDGCLLQDEEMVFTNMWANFEDPFVEWVPLIEDDEESSQHDGTEAVSDVQVAAAAAAAEEADTVRSQADEDGEILSTGVGELPRQGENVPSESVDEESAAVPGKNVEGQLIGKDVPAEVYDRLSALDIFELDVAEADYNSMSESTPRPQPVDDGWYDEDEAVIASWDGAVADGILTQMPKSGLPVTIVTGFLGSGKTTLLNNILVANHGLKIAVLVNEFGEIDIDNQLVERGEWSSDNEVLELANGCICCTINDSFVVAISKILDRRDQVNYLIVETSGVADPVPVVNSLMVSEIAEAVRIDGILTVVDAENFDPKTNMGSEAALSQITAADTILLSKTDIAPRQKVEETIEYIKAIRPAARILRSQRGRVPISMILDVGVRVSDSPAHLNPVKKTAETGSGHAHGHAHDHGHQQEERHEDASHGHSHDDEHSHDHSRSHEHNHSHDHDHDHECGSDCSHDSHSHDHSNHLEADGFVTTSFKSDAPLDADLFMDNFLQRLPEGVFRAKGLLRFYGYGGRYVFQLSGRRYQFEEDDWPDGVAPGNQLVIIGRNLDISALRTTLESCLADEHT